MKTKQVPKPFYFPWETVSTTPDEPSSLLVERWTPTPHSDSRITLYDVTSHGSVRNEIATILNQLYLLTLDQLPIFYVDEPSGTLNFRVDVKEYKHPLLLRIHKRIKDETKLNLLHRLQVHVYNSRVFSDGLGECLLPIISQATNQDYAAYRSHYVSLSRFADIVQHYSGRTEQELGSVAGKYGALQDCLQRFECLQEEMSGRSESESWSRFDKPLYRLVRGLARKASSANTGNFARAFEQHAGYLDDICHELQDFHIARSAKPLLHDFHPHNTFCDTHRCVLIYDFEDVAMGSSEPMALAFAVHRFVREYIRNSMPPSRRESKTIEPLVDLFLERYQLGGRTVSEDLKVSLHLHIKLVNLMKLLHVMCYFFRLEADPAQRTEQQWFQALHNFLAFLLEAQLFRFPSA